MLYFKRSKFCNKLIGYLIIELGWQKNAYSAGKTSGVLRSGALGANRSNLLAQCVGVKKIMDFLPSSVKQPEAPDEAQAQPIPYLAEIRIIWHFIYPTIQLAVYHPHASE